MKTTISNFAKMIFIIGVLICANSTYADTIHSTTEGGDWNSSLTWVGYTIPSPWDDVVINGSVSLHFGYCNNLTVSPTGSLSGISEGSPNNQKPLFVNGDITNYGGISPMSPPYYLDIEVHGNIYNHHYFRPNYLEFVGIGDQYVSSSKIKPYAGFTPHNLNSNKPSGYVHFNSTHYLSHLVTIDFGSDTLYMDTDTLWMEGGKIKDVTIISNSPSGQMYISLEDDFWGLTSPYVNNVNLEANEVVLAGNFLYDDFFNIYGNARVEDTLQNNTSNQTATIYGNLINNGVIRDNIGNSYLYITGDIHQNGTWTNKYTYLTGDADQNLWFTQPFEGQYLTNTNNNGKVISNSTLEFNSTILDFNYDTLMFAAGADSLIVNGDYFKEGVIEKEGSKSSGFLNCILHDDAYFVDMAMTGNINLGGLFQYNDPMSFYGHLMVTDTLQNYYVSETATIYGNLTNNGVIRDKAYFCYLHIKGDINQNGIWENRHSYLSGDVDQSLSFTKPFAGDFLTNSNINGKIICNSTLAFNNTIIDFNYDTLVFAAGADSLIVNGDYFQEAVITKEGGKTAGLLNCNLSGDAYFHDIEMVSDNINLNGAFQYQDPMSFYGHVTVEDTLRNHYVHQTATVYGDFTNNGIIEDNIWNCYLHITGDINQNGIWKNNHTYLSGDTGQNLWFTKPFEGKNLSSTKSNGKVTSNSTLAFNTTIIDFNYDTLVFASGADSLILFGGFFKEGVIIKEAGKTTGFLNSNLSGDAYLQDMEIIGADINLGGLFQYNDPMSFYGHVTIEDTLQNYYTHETATIYGDLTNNGTIRDKYYNCYLHITGDINQNGIWENNRTTLNGDSDQFIYLVNQNEITGQVYFDALSAGTPYLWYYEGGILNSADFSGETSNQLIWQVPVSGNWYGDFYCETGAGPSRTITIEGGLIVDIAVMLEGPFNGSGMNTTLNTNGHIPLSQPYNISPWNYAGTESVTSIPADIVDWVLVGFRETSAGPETATAATTIKQRALFLNNEGYLVNLDGSRDIKINVPSVTENLHIVVWHRNHLGVMSANPLSLDDAPLVYDFTSDESQAYGGSAGHKNLGGGVFGMMGGDASYDQVVDGQDKLVWVSNAGNTADYEPYDFNMDNKIDNQDKNDVWMGNNGASTLVPE
ncbi:MAG: hypothetical protein DRJ05_08835 [Bacteroidetes bacterium]|nr:MAG: hypothetical protein DRJ05_08835 [Bacteroidota bacterium]